MVDVIETGFIVGLVAGTIKFSVPLLLASLGEVFSQRSGVINLGLEGIMLVGAFFSFLAAVTTDNIFIGFIVGMISGAVMAVLLPLISESLGANQIVTGLGIWILGSGLTFFLMRVVFEGKFVGPVEGLPDIDVPSFMSDAPIVGQVFFHHDILVYVSFALVPLFYYILFRTRWGLNIRSVGENPRVAETLGINPTKIRYYTVILGGALAGTGGAYLALDYARKFTENITAGVGFVAVAIVILGRWNPVGAVLGTLLFAGTVSLQLRLQSIGFEIAPQFFFMLPYLLTIFALVVSSRKSSGPEALGEPYLRER